MSFLRICGINEELFQSFEKNVDVFDFREIEQDSDILNDITQRGVLLYEAER